MDLLINLDIFNIIILNQKEQMQHIIKSIALTFVLLVTSCNNKKQTFQNNDVDVKMEAVDSVSKKHDKANVVVNGAIKAHGGQLYDSASFAFTFRDKAYAFTNSGNLYRYEVRRNEKDMQVVDILENDEFTRLVNDEEKVLSDKDKVKYTGALNSVIYFATLPHKLNDAAVNKDYKGTTTIEGKEYDVVRVTFNEEGGGQDYDDEFYYWINAKTKTVDYLAYNYHVNGGGVRFRSAYNPRTVDGIRFQDYVNYKAPLKTPLEKLPVLYENGQLSELSRIETEDIINLNGEKE